MCISRALIALSLLVVTGCGSIGKYTAVARLTEATYEPTQEVVFFESKSPPQAYDEFAKLETKIGIGARIDQLYESMREKAKEIGADAVINVRKDSRQVMDTSGSWIPFFASYPTMEEEVVLLGEAVKYK